MEFNWKAFRWAILFAALNAVSILAGIIMTLDAPPTWWQFVKLAMAPTIISFVGTILQFCPKPTAGAIVKILTILFLSAALLATPGCSQIQSMMGQSGKVDLQNYQASKDLAVNLLKTWEFNSGFIRGSMGPKLQELPAGVVGAMDELDRLAKLPTPTDFELGFSLGARIRMLSSIVQEAMRLYAPEVIKYVPGVLGL